MKTVHDQAGNDVSLLEVMRQVIANLQTVADAFERDVHLKASLAQSVAEYKRTSDAFQQHMARLHPLMQRAQEIAKAQHDAGGQHVYVLGYGLVYVPQERDRATLAESIDGERSEQNVSRSEIDWPGFLEAREAIKRARDVFLRREPKIKSP